MVGTIIEATHANYACSAIAFVILGMRLVAQRHSRRSFCEPSAVMCMLSIVALIGRFVTNLYILRFGTANDALTSKDIDVYFLAHPRSHIKTGSILSIVTRTMATTFYWLQVCLLLAFYSSLIKQIRWAKIAVKVCWVTIVVTYLTVILATFLECRPFKLYWQISPDPGQCVRAYSQLFLQGTCNIILDLMLLVITFPLVHVRNRSWSQHLRVGTLFAIGTFCIIVTCIRLYSIYGHKSSQPFRSLWASVQLVVSTFVANAPSIYGMVNVHQRRRSDQSIRKASRPETWPRFEDAFMTGTSVIRRPDNVAVPDFLHYSFGEDKRWSSHDENAV